MLCTITSDHTIGSFNITADKNSAVLTVLEKLDKLNALCVAWSPKGKQLVVGCKNGSLVQLKPDLKIARNIAGPNPNIGSVVALLWISNYQFCAAYFDAQESQINVVIVDAPKGEANASFTCYEDITYGSLGVDGEEGGPRYYFEHISEWGLIVAASSGSSEVALLGSRDNGTTWEQWQLVDYGRAQLPLVRTSESYPVGISVDRTAVKKLPWDGEGSTLPHPVPILHILGTSGQMCSFHMVNLIPGIPAICSPPTEIVSVPSQPRASLAPSEISFSLAGTATSTPRPKQIDATSDRSKTSATPANLFPDTIKIPAPRPPPVDLNVPKPQVEKVNVLPKIETAVPPNREIKQQEKVAIDSNICINAYQEECTLFEKELKSRKEVQAVDIGTAAERNEIIEKSEEMEQFLSELKETTTGLTSDITYLKALLLQTFAWLEETKSRSSSNASCNFQSHGDNHKLKELQNLMRYVQFQREEVTRVLDDEWLEHANKEKIKMKIPKLDSVYQIMLQQSRIIAEKKNLINALVRNWKALTRADTTSSLNKSMANMSLSIMPPGINKMNGAIEQRCRTIAIRNYSFSREKQSKLKDVLNQPTTKVIKSMTPSAIQDRLEAMLSSLVTHSPPKVQEKVKNKNTPKEKKAIVTQSPSTQAAKSPLASLNQIVANVGSVGEQPNITTSSRTPALTAAPVTPPVIEVPQTPATLQTPGLGQLKQKPLAVTLFGTPQTPHKSILGAASGQLYEVSPFTTTASKSSLPSSLPAALLPTATTRSSIVQPFSKPDNSLFNLVTTKTDGPPVAAISTATSPPTTVPTVVTSPLSQTNLRTNASFASPVQTPVNQVSSYPTAIKTVTTTSISVPTSPIQSFSFTSQPASSTAFSFASRSNASPPSDAAESLDLSGMGLTSQTPANTSAENANVAPSTSGAGNNLFGSTGGSTSGSIFGGASIIPKEKPQGSSIFGNPPTSSIFGGTASGNTLSIFGGSVTASPLKPPAYGNNSGASSPSIFGGSATNSTKSIVSETPTTSPPASRFENSTNSSSSSVFGSTSGISSTQSIFGGNTASLSNAPASGGAASFPTRAFGGFPTNPVKPSTIVPGVSVPTSTPPIFGKPLDSKPLAVGSSPTSSVSSSPFGTGSTASSNSTIFGGSISNPPTASIFGSALQSPNTAGVFGTAQPVSVSQSIFGGGTSSPGAATNPGAISQTTSAVPAFGQTATFGAKPAFGSIFDTSKPIFGGGFGNSGFPIGAQSTSKCSFLMASMIISDKLFLL